jgi:hypothetical protein
MCWLGTRGTILNKGCGFRNNSGSFAIFAAIRRASSLIFGSLARTLANEAIIELKSELGRQRALSS